MPRRAHPDQLPLFGSAPRVQLALVLPAVPHVAPPPPPAPSTSSAPPPPCCPTCGHRRRPLLSAIEAAVAAILRDERRLLGRIARSIRARVNVR